MEDKKEIEALYAISQTAAKANDLKALWRPLFSEILKIMRVDAGTIMMVERGSDGEEILVRKTAEGMGDEIMHEAPIKSSQGGVSWKAVKSCEEVVINDLKSADVASMALKSGQYHSLITMPMIMRGSVIGVISIFAREGRNFTDEDLLLFKAISNQAALAVMSLSSVELLDENQRRLKELSALNQISQSVASLFNFEETLFSIVGLITKQLNGDAGLIVLFDHKDKLLKAVPPAFNLSLGVVRDFRTRTDEGATGQAFCKGVALNEEKIDLETQETLVRAGIKNIKSMLVAPLRVKSQTLGVIHVFSEKEDNFPENDLKLFTILTSSAAIVVNSSFIYRQISEERQKDEALLSSIGEGVLAVNDNRDIILLNLAGEKITGYLEEEAVGKSVENVFELTDSDKKVYTHENSPIGQVLTDGKPVILKRAYLKKHDGTLFPGELSIAATRDADGKVIGAIIAFKDISRELEVEELKQDLISIATHELRAPITGIKGYLDMILEGDTGGINNDTKETIQEVVTINQRLADLVDDLLNMSRIEQGRLEVKPTPQNLSAIISKVIKEFATQATEKNIEINFEAKKTPDVLADTDRTKQVLANLLSNAIKYTSGENKSIDISLEEKGTEIICHVKDHGIGMKQEDMNKIFQKFSRIKNEKTRHVLGTGLGLWITKKIVEMQHGKIWVASEEGKGSTFSFSLPVAKDNLQGKEIL